MSKASWQPTGHQIYPKRYFNASPTWFTWNPLTATDVHALRNEPGFEGQHIYFHHNHPIQFVRLVGLVAEIDLIAGKHVVFTLDDSSGACIEIKTTLRERKDGDHAEYPSNTVINNLDVYQSLGPLTAHIDKKAIDLGTVIKAKGSIHTFRSTRQLKLERIWIVKDTNEEAKAWSETAKWRRDVLSKPWTLTREQRNEIDDRSRQLELKEQQKSRKRRAHNAEYEQKKKRKLEKVDERRKRDEKMYNVGALPGSNVLLTRITDS